MQQSKLFDQCFFEAQALFQVKEVNEMYINSFEPMIDTINYKESILNKLGYTTAGLEISDESINHENCVILEVQRINMQIVDCLFIESIENENAVKYVEYLRDKIKYKLSSIYNQIGIKEI